MSSQLAALGGKKVRESSFPAWPHYDETEREALNRVLDSRNWWANQGKEVKEFEKEWSKYTNAKASFAVTNGTHTLEVIFLALGIGDGDEVIVADWSFLATNAESKISVPSPVNAKSETLFSLAPVMNSLISTSLTTGICQSDPTVARTVLGLNTSTLSFEKTTASKPAARAASWLRRKCGKPEGFVDTPAMSGFRLNIKLRAH